MFKAFFFNIQSFFKTIFGWRRYLSRAEKIGVTILLLIVLIFSVLWIRDRVLAKKIIPAKGGTLIEGIVGNSEGFGLGRLTLAGLTKFDRDNKIIPDLAEKWEILDEGRTYRFTLREGINTQEIINTANQNIELFGEATVDSPEDKIVQFVLTEPLSVFLPATTAPIFPYGPYKVERKNGQEIQLVSRQDYHFGEPYISRVLLKFYSNFEDLKKAIDQGEVLATTNSDEIIDNFEKFTLPLPRTISVFLNLRRDIFKDREFRQKFVGQLSLDKPGLNLTLVCSDILEAQALEFKKRVKKQGVDLEIIADDKMVILNEFVKPRNFDLLLFGFDLGRTNDYYPYWHSSQIPDPGSNFSGVSLPGLDKVLEDYRTNQNETERAKDLDQIKDLIAEQYAEIPLASEKLNYQLSKKIMGVEFPVLKEPADRFSEIYSWYLKTKRTRE